jgi:hypothetical protein
MLELKSLSSHISEWREEQLNLISKQIFKKIRSIQSPLKEECEKKKKFYYNSCICGAGEQIQSLMTIFLISYSTNTLTLIKQLFTNYLVASNKTWDEFILPISETCQPNHLLEYKINQNDTITQGEGMS